MAHGQEAAGPAQPIAKQEPREAVLIPVKTLTGDSFERLVGLLKVFDARFTADSQLRTILVYAPKDVVAQMRRVITELDRPGSEAALGRNIEMTLTLLRCSVKAAASPAPLPADIEPVARQLRATTQYKDIHVWDVLPLRLQEGKEASQSLRLPDTSLPDGRPPSILDFRILPESVARKSEGRSVRFRNLQFDFRVASGTKETQFSYQNVSLRTAGDFLEGQKTVLGKVSGTEDESAVFVVIALKVLD